MAMLTNVGADLWASALQINGAQTAITYVAVGLGVGTLSSALTNGNTYTSLPLAVPLAVAIANGQSLTLIDSGGDTQVVTATGNSIGATAIGVSSFVANATYAIGSGVVNTLSVTDIALQNEVYRIAAIPGTAGASAGESLSPGYFNPVAPSNTYLEVGYYGGSTASGTLGTGTLIARDIQFWAHVVNADSATYQLDSAL